MSGVPSPRRGWSRYDELAGPELSPDLWEPLKLGDAVRLDPGAVTTVEDGVATVDIERFADGDPNSQMLDNTKHVFFARRGFRLPAQGAACLAVELRVDRIGDGVDYRRGFATLGVADPVDTHMVFNLLSIGHRVFAEHEVLGVPGEEKPFTRVIEDPFFFSRAGGTPQPGFRRLLIELDRSAGRAVWKVDDRVLHELTGLAEMPEEVRMSFGMFTLFPVDEDRGPGGGHGGRASWRNFEYSLAGEDAA